MESEARVSKVIGILSAALSLFQIIEYRWFLDLSGTIAGLGSSVLFLMSLLLLIICCVLLFIALTSGNKASPETRHQIIVYSGLGIVATGLLYLLGVIGFFG
jgi:hypothetical protein